MVKMKKKYLIKQLYMLFLLDLKKDVNTCPKTDMKVTEIYF